MKRPTKKPVEAIVAKASDPEPIKLPPHPYAVELDATAGILESLNKVKQPDVPKIVASALILSGHTTLAEAVISAAKNVPPPRTPYESNQR